MYQISKRTLVGKGPLKTGYEHFIEMKEKDRDEAILRYKMACHVVHNMQKARKDWEVTNRVTVAEVLAKLGNAEYARFEGKFLEFVNERMTVLRDSFDWSKYFKGLSGGKSYSVKESLPEEEAFSGSESSADEGNFSDEENLSGEESSPEQDEVE